jgi:hypothetical protein
MRNDALWLLNERLCGDWGNHSCISDGATGEDIRSLMASDGSEQIGCPKQPDEIPTGSSDNAGRESKQ